MPEVGLYEAMSTLRAVRRLRTDPIPDAVLERVLQAATWAPSGGNQQPWRAIAVRDAEKRRRLQQLYIGPWKEYAASHSLCVRRARPHRRVYGLCTYEFGSGGFPSRTIRRVERFSCPAAGTARNACGGSHLPALQTAISPVLSISGARRSLRGQLREV